MLFVLKKLVRKEKKLETTAKSVDLTDAFRPKRESTPAETVVRFRRNAKELRAEYDSENKQKFCHIGIFQRPEGFAALSVAACSGKCSFPHCEPVL